MEDYQNGLLNDNLLIIEELNKKYNKIPFYAFRIRTDVDILVNKELDELFNNKLSIKYDSFSKINNYDDYKEYFYKSDHHWNHKGSYEGYK